MTVNDLNIRVVALEKDNKELKKSVLMLTESLSKVVSLLNSTSKLTIAQSKENRRKIC